MNIFILDLPGGKAPISVIWHYLCDRHITRVRQLGTLQGLLSVVSRGYLIVMKPPSQFTMCAISLAHLTGSTLCVHDLMAH